VIARDTTGFGSLVVDPPAADTGASPPDFIYGPNDPCDTDDGPADGGDGGGRDG
jgi:hypothetical protein